MAQTNAITDFIKGIERGKYRDCIEIIGTERMIVENTSGILEYCEERIRLSIGKNYVVITGAGLKLNDYIEKNIVIDGKIQNITFE